MSNRYASFQTNKEAETKGVEVLLGEGTRVTVARAGGANTAFAKALTVATKPYRKAIESGHMPEEQAQQIIHKVYAEHCVKSWEVRVDDEWVSGMDVEEDGSVVPFNKENVIRFFKEMPELFSYITESAGEVSNFQNALREDDLGN